MSRMHLLAILFRAPIHTHLHPIPKLLARNFLESTRPRVVYRHEADIQAEKRTMDSNVSNKLAFVWDVAVSVLDAVKPVLDIVSP